jgi:DNA-binding beta-propeller fold protein YncE
VIDAVSLRFIQTISWDSKVSGPLGIAVLPDGSQIFTANLNSNNIGIIRQVPASRLMSPVFEISNKDKFSRNEKERI